MFAIAATGADAKKTKIAPKNSVVSKSIKNGQVKTKDIGKGAVQSANLAAAAVKAAAVDSSQVQLRLKGSCTSGQAIASVGADGGVSCVAVGGPGAPIGPAGGDLSGTYPNPELTDLAVLTAKIADGAVNSAKVADNSLTGADIDESTLTGFWRTGGNAGTAPANDYLGTSDNQPLNLRVNGARALRLEPGSSPNLIGGAAANNVSGGAIGVTIAGGSANAASANYATIGGGSSNTASGLNATVAGGTQATASGLYSTVGGGIGTDATENFSTVGGGNSNQASGVGSTVGGGALNSALETYATVGGGNTNTAAGISSTIGGGVGNDASAPYSTVVGGTNNEASGTKSTAIGAGAVANDNGATVVASPSTFLFESTAPDEFAVRALGGSRIVTSIDAGTGVPNAGVVLPAGASAWNALSDRNSKEAIEPVEGRDVLAKLAEVPIKTWSWKTQPGVTHMGPMAQDFSAAFGLGDTNKMISSVDPDGVALAAIKGLQSELAGTKGELRSERRKRASLEQRVERLERLVRAGG